MRRSVKQECERLEGHRIHGMQGERKKKEEETRIINLQTH